MSWNVEAAFVAPTLDLARIGLDNALKSANTLGSQLIADASNTNSSTYPVINVTRSNTHEMWRPTADLSKIVAEWAAPVTVNYLAIARHDLGSKGLGGELWIKEPEGSFEKVAEFAPTSDKPFLIPFLATEIEEAEIRFGEGRPFIAVVHLGEAVVMERPLRASMQPVWLTRQTRVETQTSDGGEMLGSILVRKGNAVSPSWNNLSRDFYNGPLANLAEKLPGCGFFFQWQPAEHPSEVVWGALDGDVTGEHIARSARYTFSFSMIGRAL